MTALQRGVAAGIAVFLASAGRAEDKPAPKLDQLVKKSKATVEAIGAAKAEIVKTMDAYNRLVSDPGGLPDTYKKLQKQIAKTQERRAEILFRAAAMNAEADSVFKAWGGSVAAQGDAGRLAAAKVSYEEIKGAGRDAADRYTAVMATLQEKAAHLGRNLNILGVEDLKPDAAKLGEEVHKLVKGLDETTATANRAIAALGAP